MANEPTLRNPALEQAGLDALGDATRRAILDRLVHGPCAVGELADGLPISRSAVSQHLRVLKHAGLVVDHAAGVRRLYELHAAGIAALRAYVEHLWTAVDSERSS